MPGRSVWSDGAWAVLMLVMLLVSMVDAASVTPSCFQESKDGGVSFNGKCTAANVILKVPTKELNFDLTYGYPIVPATSFTLNITNCLINGLLVTSDRNGSFMTISGLLLYFPINGKVTGNEVKLSGKNGGQKSLACSKAFTKTMSGSFIVSVEFTAGIPLSAFNLIVKKATIYRGEKVNEWAASGWKLWTTIGGLFLLLVLIATVSGYLGWKKWGHKLLAKKRARKSEKVKKTLTDDCSIGPSLYDLYHLKPLGPGEPRLFPNIKWSWPESDFNHEHAKRLVENVGGSVNRQNATQFLREFPFPSGHHMTALSIYHQISDAGNGVCDCGDQFCHMPQAMFWFNEIPIEFIKHKGNPPLPPPPPPSKKTDEKRKP